MEEDLAKSMTLTAMQTIKRTLEKPIENSVEKPWFIRICNSL